MPEKQVPEDPAGGAGPPGESSTPISFGNALQARLTRHQLNFLRRVLSAMPRAQRRKFVNKNGRLDLPGLERLGAAGVLSGSDAQRLSNILKAAGSKPKPGGPTPDVPGFSLGNALKQRLSTHQQNFLRRLFRRVIPQEQWSQYLTAEGRLDVPGLERLLGFEGFSPEDLQRLQNVSKAAGVTPTEEETPFDPHEDGGVGGGGGGGGGGGLPDLGFDPEEPEIDLPDLPELDPEVRQAMLDRILSALREPGFPIDVLEAARNVRRGEAKAETRAQTLRAQERFAARGIGDSGIAERGFQDIERDMADRLFASLNQLDVANAQAAADQIRAAFQGALGLQESDLNAFEAALRAELGKAGVSLQYQGLILDAINSAIALELGRGELDIKRLLAEIERALAALGIASTIGSTPTTPPSTSPPPPFTGGPPPEGPEQPSTNLQSPSVLASPPSVLGGAGPSRIGEIVPSVTAQPSAVAPATASGVNLPDPFDNLLSSPRRAVPSTRPALFPLLFA